MDFQGVLFLCLKLPLFFPGSSITVWYLLGRLSGPPPTSIYFWFSMLLQAVNALFLASSSDNNFVGVEIARDFGRIFEAIKGEVLGCSVRTGVLKAGNLSLKISSQYLIRYSVTTAWTPTPRTRGDKGIVESLQENLYERPE